MTILKSALSMSNWERNIPSAACLQQPLPSPLSHSTILRLPIKTKNHQEKHQEFNSKLAFLYIIQ